jgi:histidinol-phosphate aminotransferase
MRDTAHEPTRPSARPAVGKISPYVPGRPIEDVEAEFGIRAVKLASNENPYGPSPKAVAAAREALLEVHRYPDGSGLKLREAIAAKGGNGVASPQVILGSGSSELIDLIVRAYVDPGEEVVVPAGIFRMFAVASARAGAAFVEVPTHPDLRPDLDALLARVGPSTRVVAVANPNNPTGAWVAGSDLSRFLEALPSHVVAVVDEAYFEFASGLQPGYDTALPHVAAGRNVIVLRTFSKMAGLAGLRIGYGFGDPELLAALHRIREPFNTTSVAQAAALAALADDDHVNRVRELSWKERSYLFAELSARPFVSAHPSIANFLLVDVAVPFAPLEAEFTRRGVIVRPMGGWGFPRSFRVSAGTREENEKFLFVLDQVAAAGLLGPA